MRTYERNPSGALDRVWNVGLLVLLAWGVRHRLEAPSVPLWAPDTYGYVSSGLDALNGSPFRSHEGRTFGYPLFLLLVLKLTKSLVAVASTQKAIGLATIGLALLVWRNFPLESPSAVASRSLRSLGCLVIAGLLGFGITPVVAEVTIGTEALAPLLTALATLIATRLLVSELMGRRATQPLLLVVPLVLVDLLIYMVRPSWGLATIVMMIPAILVLARARHELPKRLAVVVATAFMAIGLIFLPARIFSEADPMAQLFLPPALFAWHAPVVVRLIENDAANAGSESDRMFLLAVRRELHASLDKPLAESPLGFNADEIYYESGLRRLVQDHFEGDVERMCRFYIGYFRRAWATNPGAMMQKVLKQLWVFYKDPVRCTFQYRPLDGDMRSSIRRVRQIARSHPDWSSILEPYLSAAQAPGSLGAVPLYPAWMASTMSRVVTFAYQMVVAVVPAGGLLLLSRRSPIPARLVTSGAISMIILGSTFAHTLTFAVLHSLEEARYVENQFPMVILGIVCGAGFLFSCLTHSRSRSSAISARDSLPSGGANGASSGGAAAQRAGTGDAIPRLSL